MLCMPRSLIDKKSERRYDDCLKYTMVGSKKALKAAGLDPQVCRTAPGILDSSCPGLPGCGYASRGEASNERVDALGGVPKE